MRTHSLKGLGEILQSRDQCRGHRGHGIPLHDSDLADRLAKFAERFHAPRRGRYVAEPARTDESGVISLPPAPFDPVPFATAAGLIAAGIMLGAGYLDNDRRR
jgi:hypothetical protein